MDSKPTSYKHVIFLIQLSFLSFNRLFSLKLLAAQGLTLKKENVLVEVIKNNKISRLINE